jgi:hypothetical protein
MNELKTVCKEAVVANFKALSSHVPVVIDEHRRTAGLRFEIWTLDLPNAKQEC